MRRGYVIGIARQAVADDLGVDFRAARLGVLIFFEHQYARAFAHDEAVTILVVRTACLLWLVIEVGRQRAGLGKAGDADRADRGFRSAGEHDVGIVVLDHPRGVADRMRAGRAGGDDGMIRLHQAVFDRNLPGNEIDQPAVHEVRADPARPFLVQDQTLALYPGKTANPRADRAARAQLGRLVHVEKARILDRLAGGIDAEDDERIDLALGLVIDPLVRVEAIFMIRRLHFAGDAALLVAGVELRDRSGAAPRGQDVFPGGLDVAAQRRHQPETCHDDTAHHWNSVMASKTNGLPMCSGSRWCRLSALSAAEADPISPCSGRYTRSHRGPW